ncbi:MAG: M48 family metalloprotease [Caldimicrobium sp.]|nr:M48 family metalloprotease [Caldimicrobium sp.]MCX7873893.1 M48 family metalloprotease [Caldimicrobium sp.]MDW8094823.1 M48 family metalloprotease [Caldimicrobium sp.]
MIYEDLLAFWLAFLIWEFLPPSLEISLSPFVIGSLFIGKELLFLYLLLYLRRRFFFSLGHLPSLIDKLLLMFVFLLFILDLSFFGFKKFLSGYYFGATGALLWFAHYYILSKLTLYPLTVRYLRIIAGLLFPFFLLLVLDETLEYLSIDFRGRFFLLLFIILLISPYIIIKIWPVRRMTKGFLYELITAFLEKLRLRFRDYLVLPSIGPKFYTAGVLGFLPPFRYLFFSSSLLEILNEREVLGVVAHEAGHLKRKHGLILLVVLLSFPLLLLNFFYFISLILHLFFEDRDSLVKFLKGTNAIYFEVAIGLGLLLLSLLFFRYIFAFFLRSLEREADLFALYVLKDPEPLISALQKIGEVTGQLFRKSWHHYGLWERISYIKYATAYPQAIRKHSLRFRKLLLLWLFLNLLPLGIFLSLEVGLWRKLLQFLFS